MMVPLRSVVATLVCAVALVGCTQQRPSMGELLRMASMTYNEGLRWQRFTDCAGYLPPEQRDSFLRKMEDEREELSFVEYDVRRTDLNADVTAATIEVDYTWYRLPSTTLQTTRMRQRWSLIEDQWTLLEQTRIERKDEPEDPAELLKMGTEDLHPGRDGHLMGER